MRILYLHQYFNTPNMIGSTRSFEMAKRFVQAGHEVHVVTSRRDCEVTKRKWKTTNEAGIAVHWFPIPYENSMGFSARLNAFFRFVAAARKKAIELGGDIVFATSTPLTIALPAVSAKKRLRIPMVFEVRDLWPKVPIGMGLLRNPVLKWLARRLEKYAYDNSDSIVALSPGMTEGIVASGYDPAKIHMIPNGSDIHLFDVPADVGTAFRTKRDWLGNRPLVVYLGTLGRVNGTEYLVLVASEVSRIDNEIRFLVVGDGAEKAHVRDLAEQKGVLEQTFWMEPPIAKSAVPTVNSAATVAASTVIDVEVLHHNSANKVFDAFASGTPVVINHRGWQADLLESEDAGIALPADDVAGAAKQLVELLHDQDRLSRMAANSRRLAHERFNRDDLARQLLMVLEDVANGDS